MANLIDDPSFEANVAPTSYGTPTSSARSNEQAHSGTYSWKIVSGGADKGIEFAIPTTSGLYYAVSVWLFCVTGSAKLTNVSWQKASSAGTLTSSGTGYWVKLQGIFRATGATSTLRILATGSYTFYVDDLSVIVSNSVSITCTPANLANSTEGAGALRADGSDNLLQPATVGTVQATIGAIEFGYQPRHSADTALKFGGTPVIFHAYGNATNYILVEWSAANTMRLSFNCGGGAVSSTWDATGAIVAGTTYTIKIEYTATGMKMYVDAVEKINAVGTVNFSTVPTVGYFGMNQAGSNQADAVYS